MPGGTITSQGPAIEARTYGEIKRPEFGAATDRLAAAMYLAFDHRVETRGCSFIYAQTYLMNGVEP